MYISKHQIGDTIVADGNGLDSSEKWLGTIVWIITSLTATDESHVTYYYSLLRTWSTICKMWTSIFTVTEVLNDRERFRNIIDRIIVDLTNINRDTQIYIDDYNKKILALQAKQTLVDTYTPMFVNPELETATVAANEIVWDEVVINNDEDEDDNDENNDD